MLANIDLELAKNFAMSSFQELQDPFLLSYENNIIDDNDLSVLHDEFMLKNPEHIIWDQYLSWWVQNPWKIWKSHKKLLEVPS